MVQWSTRSPTKSDVTGSVPVRVQSPQWLILDDKVNGRIRISHRGGCIWLYLYPSRVLESAFLNRRLMSYMEYESLYESVRRTDE